MEENIIVTNVRAAVPAGFTPVYVGRTMPGREGSVFGNPLPLAGKRWTEEARHWSDVLARHPDARVRQVAEQALGAREVECSRIHISAEVPKYLASRSAVSGEMPRLPLTMSLMRPTGTSMSRASLLRLTPRGFIAFSSRITPGCAGGVA